MVGTAKKKISKAKRKKRDEENLAAEEDVWKWILDEQVRDSNYLLPSPAMAATGDAPDPDDAISPPDSSSSQQCKLPSISRSNRHRHHPHGSRDAPIRIELHCHTTCSDGRLSPEELVERASRHGVSILAVTDHDTLAGVPAAMAAAAAGGGGGGGGGMRIIPGVEISAWYIPRNEAGKSAGESVHILGYFGGLGPAPGPGGPALHRALARVRAGRHTRARAMVARLQALGVPLTWQHVVANLQPPGVAPTRPHIARALVEIGHVATEQEAFTRYLKDGGPAYVRGEELPADVAVKLVCQAGGIAVLAHPWCLANAASVVHHLASVGLHGMEVFRSGKKDPEYVSMADVYGLMKLGGSDFHGRQERCEQELGSVPLSAKVAHAFVGLGCRVWNRGFRDLVMWLDARRQRLTPSHPDEGGGDTSPGSLAEELENVDGAHEKFWGTFHTEPCYEDPFLVGPRSCVEALGGLGDGFDGEVGMVKTSEWGVGPSCLVESMKSTCTRKNRHWLSGCMDDASVVYRSGYLATEEWLVLHAEMTKVGLKYEHFERGGDNYLAFCLKE